MSHKRSPANPKRPWGLICLILLFPAIMIPLSFVDLDWTVWLNENSRKRYGRWMQQTMFDGGYPGASDPAILFQFIIALFYLSYSYTRSSKLYHRVRPFLGFIFFSSLFVGLGLVHSIKWVVGRARPNLVLKGDELPYSDWYEFGHFFVSDGIFFGSFPSGHTATIFMLITISYVLAGNPADKGNKRYWGWLWGLIVLIYTFAMIAGRSISFDHWLTDSVGITLLSWIWIHVSYYYILKIPEQVQHVAQHGTYFPIQRYWEIGLLWRMFLLAIGAMGTIIGIRSFFMERSPWLVGLVIPGVVLVIVFTVSVIRNHRKSTASFLSS